MMNDEIIIAYMVINFIIVVWNTYELSKWQLNQIVTNTKLDLHNIRIRDLERMMDED